MTTIKSSGDFHYLFGCSKKGIKLSVIQVYFDVFLVLSIPPKNRYVPHLNGCSNFINRISY